MKTLEDERYVVIKAYKRTFSEIWRDFLYWHVLHVRRIPTYRVYRLYDYGITEYAWCWVFMERTQSMQISTPCETTMIDDSKFILTWVDAMLCTQLLPKFHSDCRNLMSKWRLHT